MRKYFSHTILSTFARYIYKCLSFLANLLFPEHCLSCKKEGSLLCKRCLVRLPRAHTPEYDFIHPIFDYRSPLVRELIWRLKYKNARHVAKLFGETLHTHLLDILSDDLGGVRETILLIPIPLHKARLHERGYNQSKLLVDALLLHDQGNNFSQETQAIKRNQNTLPQARRETRQSRFKNLTHAFAVTHPEKIRGNVVVLVDDVTTTGATLSEAKRALKRAGARRVLALTLAH